MPRRVLVVDDCRTVRAILSSALHDAGYEVTAAEDGFSGLDCLQRESYDAVLVDVNMPGMDGISFVRRLRERCTAPVVMVTTENGAALMNQGREAGANAWIVKPLQASRLVSVLNQLGA